MPEERDALQRHFERISDYFVDVYGHPARADEVEQLFLERPPGLRADQARTCGVFRGDDLVGVIEYLIDFPNPSEWYIGLFTLDPAERSRGHGEALMAAFDAHARHHGATALRVAVIETRAASKRFWERRGYAVEARVGPSRYGVREHFVLRMRKALL